MAVAVDLSRFHDRFRLETRERLGEVDRVLQRMGVASSGRQAEIAEEVRQLTRLIHSVKGSARMVGYSAVDRLCHAMEDLLHSLRNQTILQKSSLELLWDARRGLDRLLSLPPDYAPGAGSDDWLAVLMRNLASEADPKAAGELEPIGVGEPAPILAAAELSEADVVPWREPWIRVEAGQLDELLATCRRLQRQIAAFSPVVEGLDRAGGEGAEEGTSLQYQWKRFADGLSTRIRELERNIMRLRMRPLSDTFANLPAQIDELARGLGKRVKVEVTGGDTLLDGAIVETLGEVVVHLVRNAVDHGIESPSRRREAGKNEEGWIWIGVRDEGGWAQISVADDGSGIDLDEVWRRAHLLGLTTESKPPAGERRRGLNFLFDDRFTTRESAGLVSGRGVGLATVRRRIQEMRGRVSIESEPGMFTRVILTIPTSLRLVPVQKMLVRFKSKDLAVGLPSYLVQQLARGETGRDLPQHGEMIPVVSLSSVLEGEVDLGEVDGEVEMVYVSDGIRTAGLSVDAVLDSEELLVESPQVVSHLSPLVAGAAVIPGGRVLVILNGLVILDRVWDRWIAGRERSGG